MFHSIFPGCVLVKRNCETWTGGEIYLSLESKMAVDGPLVSLSSLWKLLLRWSHHNNHRYLSISLVFDYSNFIHSTRVIDRFRLPWIATAIQEWWLTLQGCCCCCWIRHVRHPPCWFWSVGYLVSCFAFLPLYRCKTKMVPLISLIFRGNGQKEQDRKSMTGRGVEGI